MNVIIFSTKILFFLQLIDTTGRKTPREIAELRGKQEMVKFLDEFLQ
jgi:hypothetical protein